MLPSMLPRNVSDADAAAVIVWDWAARAIDAIPPSTIAPVAYRSECSIFPWACSRPTTAERAAERGSAAQHGAALRARFPRARLWGLREERLHAGGGRLSPHVVVGGSAVLMMPTTYTFHCWRPVHHDRGVGGGSRNESELSSLSTVANSFTNLLSMREAAGLAAIISLSHEYDDECGRLGRLMRFWPYTPRFETDGSAVWAERRAAQRDRHAAQHARQRQLAISSAGEEERCCWSGGDPSGCDELPYIFTGGSAGRDDHTLRRALRGLPVTIRSYDGRGSRGNGTWEGAPRGGGAVRHMPVVSQPEFVRAMEEALFVAVPLNELSTPMPENRALAARLRAAGARPKLVTGLTTVVEALARGKVVVTTARGGPAMWREYIEHGRNGYLLPANDTAAWRNVTLHLLDSCRRGRLRVMEERVLAHARELFSTEALGRRLASIVDAVQLSV